MMEKMFDDSFQTEQIIKKVYFSFDQNSKSNFDKIHMKNRKLRSMSVFEFVFQHLILKKIMESFEMLIK